MDSLSHAVVGALLGKSLAQKKEHGRMGLAGMIGAMMPDLDVFIGSEADPLLNLEYHRHFTHSLLVAPLGGLLAALVLHRLFKKQLSFASLFWASFLGYLSGIFLDLCTTYGTRIFWPFSLEKHSLNNISIVDPLFTLPLLGLVVLSWRKRSALSARVGLLFMAGYLLLGGVQNQRAHQLQAELARERGHHQAVGIVRPSFGNLLVWRSLYEYGGEYYVDALRPGLFGEDQVYRGESHPKYLRERDLPDLPSGSRLEGDIRRFEEFSQGYVIWDPYQENMLTDVRYAMLPYEIRPIWGIRVWPLAPDRPAHFLNVRKLEKARMRHIPQMIQGVELDPPWQRESWKKQ